jgi:hypothetical protein
MLIPQLAFFEFALVMLVVDFLENIHESAVILLKNRILSGQVQRVVSLNGKLERRVSELINRFVGVVHSHHDTWAFELENLHSLSFESLVIRLEGHNELSRHFWGVVGCPVLVAKRVATDHDGLSPAWYMARDVLDNDRLTENRASKFVSDGAVW